MSFVYKGLKGTKKRHIVTEEEVQKQLQHLVESRPRVTVITDRRTQNGDEVLLDYAGFCGDHPFEGGTAENQTLVLGSGTFIPGFEEQLIGKCAGEKVTVKVTFPKEYHAPELAGKDAEFRCTIHEIHELSKYRLDDTFAREVGQVENLEQMQERMGRSMQYYQDEQSEMALQDSLLQQAAMTLDMEITDRQMEQAVDEQMQNVEAQLQQQGLSLKMYCQFMQTTVEELRKKAEPTARQNLRTAAAIRQITRLEGLTAEPEEMDRARRNICDSNGITMEQLNAMKDQNLDEMVEHAVLSGKVMSLIREAAEITEEQD